MKPWGPVLEALRNGLYPFRVELRDDPFYRPIRIMREDVRTFAGVLPR